MADIRTTTQAGRLFDRTLRNLRGTWREIARSARIRFAGGSLRADLPDDDLTRLRERMQACITGRGGEVSARARAADLGRSYLGLSEARLRDALVAPATRLLTQFTTLPDGVKFLVDLRADVMDQKGDPAMAALDGELRRLLASWFDIGFLDLQRITWPARPPCSRS